MRNCIAIIFGAALVLAACAKADTVEGDTIYNSNPDHLWNRLNRTLFLRTALDGQQYGLNELDILYWYRTTNLLAGVSHQRALSVLDEFINQHGERLIDDPLKKALLQRDLWALFDWAAAPLSSTHKIERMDLLKRLAIVIRRLELTTNEIASLPDNYALAIKNHLSDLPAGLFSTNGIWINISAGNVERIAPAHTMFFGGRSVFSVWFHDANGRQAGLNYLKQLDAFKPMFIYVTNRDSQSQFELDPNLPQFSINSQWALARCLCLIDTDGRIQPTHVVESIQTRTYRGLGQPDFVMTTNQNGRVVPEEVPRQRFNEFRMTRDSQASLISIPQEGREFNKVPFMIGIDPFEYHFQPETNNGPTEYRSIVLRSCMECHSGPGICSVNSFTRFLSFSYPPPGETTHLMESPPEHENEVTVDWKQQQFDWGLLQGLWMQNTK